MAEIAAALVKELRARTGAGMMDCKKALAETRGEFEAAVDWLRKKGLAAAAKKAGRVAAEGLIGVAVAGLRGALVEVNSETDFVARNREFQDYVRKVAEVAVATEGELEALKAAPYPGSGETVEARLTHLIATVGENMNLRRVARVDVGAGLVASYMHNALAPGVGKIGVLVGLETTAASTLIETFARQLAMHVAAANPQAISRADVDPTALERERNVLAEQARASGKSDAIVAKMVEGRLKRFFEDVCLLEQTYVIDGESKVSAALEGVAKRASAQVGVAAFARMALGEGIDRKEGDFASEVAAALGG